MCVLLAAIRWVVRLNVWVGRLWFSVSQPPVPRCRDRSPARPCGFGSCIPPRLEMSQGMAGKRGF